MEDYSNNKKSSPARFWQAAAISAGVGIIGGLMGRKKRRAEQRAAKGEYDKMRKSYEGLDTSNIYADVKNPYAGLQSNFENVYEDLTVNQQQAQFQAQQGGQQRANIMQGLRGAAGSSGIAGLAQSLANQGQRQTQQISASIGQQEAANQRMSAQGAAGVQRMEAGREQLIASGESQAEAIRLAGQEQSRALEYQKQSTMLGMAQQRYAGANETQAAAQQQVAGGLGNLVGAVGGGYAAGGGGSDAGFSWGELSDNITNID